MLIDSANPSKIESAQVMADKNRKSKIGWKRFVLFNLILLSIAVSNASTEAAVSVNLNLDRTEATLADSVRMVVTVSGSRDTQSKPVIKGLENFKVRQGGTSSRVEIINGKVNAGIDYTYYLQSKKTGTFQIGPAEVEIDGKRYQSQSRTLRVVQSKATEGSKRAVLFLSAEISSNEVYVEEQTQYTLKLYSRANIRDISLSLPEHEQLVFKQLGKPREYQSTVNGRNYEVLEVRYLLVASGAGSFVMEPAKMNMTVLEPRNRRRRSLFDDPFFRDPFFSFSSGRPVTVSGESLELTVLQLPEKGKPNNFSGLVGKFTIDSQLEPAAVTAGESATLTVQVKGQGNAQRIPDLKFPELKNIKVYADQPVLNVEQSENGLGGAKTMKWALVPEEQGRIAVPSMTLSFFDPDKEQYMNLESKIHTLSVSPADTKQTPIAQSTPGSKDMNEKAGKQEIKSLGRDILPIHTSMKVLTAQSSILSNGILSYGLLLGPFLIYLVTFLSLRLRQQQVEILTLTRAKKAAGELIKQCRQGNFSHEGLMDAIRGYLNHRFTLSLGVLTADEAAGLLRSKGVKPETTEKLRSLVQALENAVYTGKGHEHSDQAKTLSDLVKAIEKEIR